jgi:hypothetical protein
MLRLLLIVASALSANAPTTKPAAPPVIVRVQRVDVGKQKFDLKARGLPADAKVLDTIETLAVPGSNYRCAATAGSETRELAGSIRAVTDCNGQDQGYQLQIDFSRRSTWGVQQAKTSLMLKADEPALPFLGLYDQKGNPQGDIFFLSLVGEPAKK